MRLSDGRRDIYKRPIALSRRPSLIVIAAVCLLLTACIELRPESLPVELPNLSDIPLPNVDDILNSLTPTPLPTSPAGILKFTVPNYRIDLASGERVPGTQLVYLNQTFDSENQLIFNVQINGQQQVKRANDSFYWQGVLAPSVQSTFDLRLGQAFSNEKIKATGTAEITLFNPIPAELEIPLCSEQSICLDDVLYDIYVRPSDVLQGTTLTFVGENGGNFTFTSAVGQQTYRLNDSLVWRGRLLDNVFANHELRLISYQNGQLRMRGNTSVRIFGR